ncbi:hypothetical protein Tco_1202258 [Tanacetum coccineum]
MANQEQNPPQQEQSFVAATQVDFNLEDILLDTNNKVSFSIPTGGIYEEVGVNTFRNAIGAHYLPHSSEYVAPPSIDIVRPWFETIGYQETVPAKRTLKKSLLPPRWSLANGINIDYASIFWEDIIIKLNNKHREKVVPYTRFLSLLMMHKMKEGYRDGEVTPYPTQFYSVNNWALKPNQPEGPPFTEHMLVVFSAAKPVVFKAPKPSSNAKRVPQGIKPGAKPEHKKHLTSSKQPYVSNSELQLQNKGYRITIQEPSVTQKTAVSFISSSKGKAIMIESEKPVKIKDQIAHDEQVAKDLHDKIQVELEEEAKRQEEASMATIAELMICSSTDLMLTELALE